MINYICALRDAVVHVFRKWFSAEDLHLKIILLAGISTFCILIAYLVSKVFLKDISELIPITTFIVFSSVFVIFSKDPLKTLAILCLFTIPYNRFLILYERNSYILGRISDYIIVSLSVFEIPLYAFAAFSIMKLLIPLFRHKKSQTFELRLLRQRSVLEYGLFAFLLINVLFSFVGNSFPFSIGISRIQIALDALIFFYVLKKTGLDCIAKIIIFSGVLQSLIGILQVSLNHSIGLYSFGESQFNSGLYFIAKTMLFGQLLVRAYGTFPHPNILGCFLILSVFLLAQKSSKLSPNDKYDVHSSNLIGRGKYIFKKFWREILVLTILVCGIFATQSRVIIISLFILSLFLVTFYLGGLKRKNIIIVIMIMLGLLSIGVLVFRERVESLLTYDKSSFTDRVMLADVAKDMIDKTNIVTGMGPNSYLLYLSQNKAFYSGRSLIIEPVHNIFLLTLCETGIIGLGILIIMLADAGIKTIRFLRIDNNVLLKTISFSIIVTIMLIGFLDHYFITIKQGSLMLILLFYVLGEICYPNNKNAID